jgi:hypothetical protein
MQTACRLALPRVRERLTLHEEVAKCLGVQRVPELTRTEREYALLTAYNKISNTVRGHFPLYLISLISNRDWEVSQNSAYSTIDSYCMSCFFTSKWWLSQNSWYCTRKCLGCVSQDNWSWSRNLLPLACFPVLTNVTSYFVSQNNWPCVTMCSGLRDYHS